MRDANSVWSTVCLRVILHEAADENGSCPCQADTKFNDEASAYQQPGCQTFVDVSSVVRIAIASPAHQDSAFSRGADGTCYEWCHEWPDTRKGDHWRAQQMGGN